MTTSSLKSPKKRPELQAVSAVEPGSEPMDDHDEARLNSALEAVQRVVPPLWPLQDYVAVNPYQGLADRSFLEAGLQLQSVRRCEFLMGREGYARHWESGRLNAASVEAALAQAAAEYPQWYAGLTVEMITGWLAGTDVPLDSPPGRIKTVSEQIDSDLGSQWTGHLLNDITRHCAAHFDQGQAAWQSPWKQRSLFEAWRSAARISRRMDLLGLKGFRKLVRSLPDDSGMAIRVLLSQLGVPEAHWKSFLIAEIFSVAGWASFVRNQEEACPETGCSQALQDLLAIRLAYDAALKTAFRRVLTPRHWPKAFSDDDSNSTALLPQLNTLMRYVLQMALELQYRNDTLRKLTATPATSASSARKSAQFVFCIDVRSEVFRRHLEAQDPSVETFGFAGFFGAAIAYSPLGESSATSQCPVLLKPAYAASEVPGGAVVPLERQLTRQHAQAAASSTVRSLKGSVCGGFSFVETLGLGYFGRLIRNSISRRNRSAPAHAGQCSEVRLTPTAGETSEQQLARQVGLAEAILRNLGLTSGFARLVFLCGHAAEVANNPYKGALACGACGGHSGEPNARLVAGLLNDPQVRLGLAQRGVSIPEDTRFIAAVHETTTDDIHCRDLEGLPQSHQGELNQVRDWLQRAGELCRRERSAFLNEQDAERLLERGADWAQVRPEWGLAGNAAFIVAPRWKTAGQDFGGRTFLHSYDRARDPEKKTLELILTAPMVVTNWINLQYYASAVDPVAYGSGNKTIHNVVGRFGVLHGNGGDLMTGLPLQCVHDGEQLRHEPLRLQVIVDADRNDLQAIIQRHPHVRDLVSNGWLTLIAWEGNQFSRWSSDGQWKPCEPFPSASGDCREPRVASA